MPAAVLAFTAAAFLLVGGGRAFASHVDCGDTITADATLDSDLEDCPNNGVVIGAAGITLDLNGHRIDGDGTPAAGCDLQVELCDVGVLNEGFNGVTVEHGSLRRFAFGGFTVGARKNRVLDIGSTRHVLFGWVMADSTRSVIRAGAFRRNIAPEGDGLGLFGCDHVRVRNNAIRRNPVRASTSWIPTTTWSRATCSPATRPRSCWGATSARPWSSPTAIGSGETRSRDAGASWSPPATGT